MVFVCVFDKFFLVKKYASAYKVYNYERVAGENDIVESLDTGEVFHVMSEDGQSPACSKNRRWLKAIIRY